MAPPPNIPTTPKPKSHNAGAIAGGVVGGVVCLVVLILLGMFFRRRQQRNESQKVTARPYTHGSGGDMVQNHQGIFTTGDSPTTLSPTPFEWQPPSHMPVTAAGPIGAQQKRDGIAGNRSPPVSSSTSAGGKHPRAAPPPPNSSPMLVESLHEVARTPTPEQLAPHHEQLRSEMEDLRREVEVMRMERGHITNEDVPPPQYGLQDGVN